MKKGFSTHDLGASKSWVTKQNPCSLYIKAAEQGYAIAQSNLGHMYESGSGVLKDVERACMWQAIGATNGDDVAANKKQRLSKLMTSGS